jgi:hypothetical protein
MVESSNKMKPLEVLLRDKGFVGPERDYLTYREKRGVNVKPHWLQEKIGSRRIVAALRGESGSLDHLIQDARKNNFHIEVKRGNDIVSPEADVYANAQYWCRRTLD